MLSTLHEHIGYKIMERGQEAKGKIAAVSTKKTLASLKKLALGIVMS